MYEYRHVFSGARLFWTVVETTSGGLMHETTGCRHRSHYQDPNHMATAVKWRHTTPTASDDEKVNTVSDEKTSTDLTTTAYFRRTCQCSMWFNGKIVVCRVFEKDLSSTSHNKIISDWHVITELQILCSRVHLLVRFRSISSLLHRCVSSGENVYSLF